MSNKKIKSNEPEKNKPDYDFLQKEVSEYKNKYLRALADYQNLEARFSEEKKEIENKSNRKLVLQILPFLDNLEKAEVFVKDQGLKIARDELYRVFQGLGLEEVEVQGKEYDPYTAEVVEIVKGDKDNIVSQVLRKGYKLGNRIIRIAQVKVTKKA